MNSLFFVRVTLRRCVLLTGLMLILLLSACGGDQPTPASTAETINSADNNGAVEAVQNYLTAKVSNNDERVRRLLCSEREADFEMEASSFDAVTEGRIENMACTLQSEGLVACTGQIVATYGTEDQDFPLGAYRVVQEDGEWKWCGEAATDSLLPGGTAEAIGE
jgi:hypothetical protein